MSYQLPGDNCMERPKRVLIVEDDAHIADLLRLHLRDEGYVVEHADDGNLGVRMLEEGQWDALVLDLMLPGVDGLEATRSIRADMNPVPIVAMTANAFVVDRHACLNAGMDDHLSKPVRPENLYAVLMRWLETQRRSQAA